METTRTNHDTGDNGDTGISCRVCGCRHMIVWRTRQRRRCVRRERKCRNCGAIVITHERAWGDGE